MLICTIVALAAASHGEPLSAQDLARAALPRPLPSSHVVGSDPAGIFAAMNRHLVQMPHHTRPCETHSLEELDQLSRLLWAERHPDLATVYAKRNDKRKFHFNTFDYKERLWAAEQQLVATDPAQFGVDSAWYSMVRDGKCSEIVMWWVHHLTEDKRSTLSGVPGFSVPLMPVDGTMVGTQKQLKKQQHPRLNDDSTRRSLGSESQNFTKHNREYIYQVQCTDCHYTRPVNTSATPHAPSANIGAPEGEESAVPPGTCPLGVLGKPSVWYEPMSDVGHRRKRCDWDYDPPCGLCEGVGGYAWGDAEHDITYIDCKPVALAKDLDPKNITNPVWPKAFVVHEVTTLINQISEGGTFPGADPCAKHNFKNDTEVFYFDDSRVNFDGPIIYTNTSKTDIWTLPTADMFIKIDKAFCICVSPYENGNKSTAPLGPLVHDFAHDAVLVGREVIGLEGLNMSVEADHWNKGPHHFWVSVATNEFVRGWQPWNGLNVYTPGTWTVGPVAAEMFQVPKSCYEGLLHKNITCKYPYDPPRQPLS